VATVSSTEHKPGHINFADLMSLRDYNPRTAYQQSKLANTIFGIELDRRLRRADSPISSVLAHPGVSATNLTPTAFPDPKGFLIRRTTALMAEPPDRGALPQLYAATALEVLSGQFFDPSSFQEMRGHVTEVHAAPEALDLRIARRL